MKPENSITRRRAEIAEAYSRIVAGEPNEDELILWWSDQVHELRLLEQERAMQNSESIPARYIRENFEPTDRIALVILDKQNGLTLQRITSAANAASPKYQAWLRAENAAGKDIYIGMNSLAPAARGRTKDDVAVVRHIYLDLDAGGKDSLDRVLASNDLPDPNHVLHTSPEKHQIVWRARDFSKEQAEELQRGMAARYGADLAATDCSRVLRLPGFTNRKPAYTIDGKQPWVTAENRSTKVYRPGDFPAVEHVLAPATRIGHLRPGAAVTQSERDWNYALRHLARGESPAAVVEAIMRFRPDTSIAKANEERARSAKSRAASQIDFDSLTEEQFLEFCGNAVAQAKRWVVMSCAWQHAAQLEKTGVPLVRLGCWHKPNAAPQFTGDRPSVGREAIAILHREGKKRWNGGRHHAVWACNVDHGEHRTQKPLKLLMDWVAKFTDPGETILDPFCGSGTSGVACAKLGRKFIGIEKRADYFDLACRRTDAYRQADMFAPMGT
jgi:hypothetical protein